MQIHLAGYYTGKSSAYDIEDYPYFLESYHYISGRHCDAIRADDRKIFLDSGAYSAMTQGVEIDLLKYAAFQKKHADVINVASVLDYIDFNDPINAAKKTLANQKALESEGCEVVPCFHYGEPWSYLEDYVDQGYEYISLGGMVPIATVDLIPWLDYAFGHIICGDDGMPRCKIHGFGVTTIELMDRYPFFSVDSTSWILAARFGMIFYPMPSNPYFKLTLSDQSPKRKEFDKHYDSLSEVEQQEIVKRIADRGFDVEELRTIYWKRDLWNIDFFHGLCDQIPWPRPFYQEQDGFFS